MLHGQTQIKFIALGIFFFYLLIYLYIYTWYKSRAVIQLNNQTIFQYNNTVPSLALPHSHRCRAQLLTFTHLRYLPLTISPFKSLSLHNPSYLSPTVFEHTLTV
jgi:hypothetical protein